MARIVSIESSTFRFSVALHIDGKLIAQEESDVPQQTASQLAVSLQRLLKNLEGPPDAVAVASGPGSYTGLRIGVATAKGLCFATGARLIAIPTLELMAHHVRENQKQKNTWYCPMLDARRMEVYTAMFDEHGKQVVPTSAHVVMADSFVTELTNHSVLFFGDGAAKCKSTLQHANATFLDDVHPQAAAMGPIAESLWDEGKWVHAPTFEPFYLKEFVAKKPKAFF